MVSDVLVREADLKSWVADYDLHHLSVHGIFTRQEPLLSYLKLIAGGQDDVELTAAEMFGLPLEQSAPGGDECLRNGSGRGHPCQ